MGYVPPPRPSGIIILPANATYSNVEEYRRLWYENVAGKRGVADSYRRYVRDLYGERGWDLFPYLGYVLLLGIIALVGLVVLAVVR